MADSYNKANIDFVNIDLIKFVIYNKILLAYNIKKTCCK